MEPPKGITYTAVYEPDMECMVKALKLVLGCESEKDEQDSEEIVIRKTG